MKSILYSFTHRESSAKKSQTDQKHHTAKSNQFLYYFFCLTASALFCLKTNPNPHSHLSAQRTDSDGSTDED